MHIKQGDLVACYITNTDQWEMLMSWGIVLEVNPNLEDVLVLDNDGRTNWWPHRRWKILSSKKNIKQLDIELKLA